MNQMHHIKQGIGILSLIFLLFPLQIWGADVITNGTFNSNITTGWTSTTGASTEGTTEFDGSTYGNASGSVKGATDVNRTRLYEWYLAHSLGNVNTTDDVSLSFWWYKASTSSSANLCTAKIRLVRPAGDTVDVWTNTQIPSVGSPLSGNVTASNISSSFNANGTYTILLYGDLANPNDKYSQAQINFDDVIVDVTGAANNAPTISNSASVNRIGANTTTISADFTDVDQPAVSSFTVTFKVKDVGETEYTLVNALTHGIGGLTVIDNTGGSYTASYTWDPGAGQTVGDYDLYFYVSDGIDNVTDGYVANTNELLVQDIAANNPPTLTSGATAVSVSPTNRYGTNNTVISATYIDTDDPGIGAFTVTFKIREPNNSTELVLINSLGHGSGGLIITDNGGGSYTAQYSYNPDDAQTLGLYDLYFEVTDGSDNVIDDFSANLNELELDETLPPAAPTIASGATGVAPGSIDRFGVITTTINVPFTDIDQPGINEFFIKITVSAPYFQGTTVVADSLKHGQGGLTITDGGGGSYTASIAWDPPDDAVTGYYDIQAIVADQLSNAVDEYADNPDELLITNGGENSPPIVATDATFASPAGIERIGTNPTTLSATFTDSDAPAVSVFTVSFKIREPNNTTEIILATNVAHGAGGVTITDLGIGIYEATIAWDPGDAQTIGFYDLFFDVTEGTETSTDDYSYNENELEVYDAISNNAPTVVPGATTVIPTSFTRIGTDFTIIKTLFTDVDLPGALAFTITYKVRDASSTEYTIVNAATHDTQGLRVRHLTGPDYEASFVWDPSDAQAIGDYDLQFYVEDNASASATDPYASNNNELNLVSTTPAGDGYLLRRNNIASSCGGTASACHNVVDHQNQDCLVCHTPHGTSNIYLIRETITTPSDGDQTVLFKSLGTPDAYNTVPSEIDDAGGSMASDANNVQNEVCEVCHRTTNYYRNDDSHTSRDHHNVENCTSCHPHADAFAGSGGESSGGSACNCHSAIMTSMDSTSMLYRHILANNDADYSPGIEGMYTTKNCLSCHVDHDIFRPDLNIGFGQRGRNLRVDWAIDPVQGNSTSLTNSDYSSSGNGGICLSCHAGPSCQGCHSAHSPEKPGTIHTALGSFSHEFIVKSDFDAATTTHNYNVPSTYTTDGSTFNANCTKCHNDDRSKSYQSSTYKFSLHGSTFDNLIDSTGIASATNPIEEELCFKCHSTTSNPNAGSNLDFFGVKSMSNQSALDIEASFSKTYTHPTLTYSGRHSLADSALSFADGNRHAECGDCHSVHAARAGTHDGTTSLASNALKGVWGVRPTSWPAAPTPTDNANVFAAPSGYTVVNDGTVKEYEICLKCHSNYTTLPSGSRNLAAEINPNYPSTHGITIANQNSYCNTTTMFEPWGSSGMTYCSDCHRSDISTDPEGPHGSNQEHLLVATIVSDDVNGTPLCLVCHQTGSYWAGDNGSRYPEHPGSKRAHKLAQGCFACHMWDYSSTSGLGVSTTSWSGGTPPANLLVHGQNKIHNFRDRDGSTGSGQPVDAFVNGMMSDMDYTARECWSEVCKTHSGTNY